MKVTITTALLDPIDTIEQDAWARGFADGKWAAGCLFYFGMSLGAVLGGAIVLLLHAFGR